MSDSFPYPRFSTAREVIGGVLKRTGIDRSWKCFVNIGTKERIGVLEVDGSAGFGIAAYSELERFGYLDMEHNSGTKAMRLKFMVLGILNEWRGLWLS